MFWHGMLSLLIWIVYDDKAVEKVSWPTFAQLQSSTIVVMVASLIFALVVLVMDISFENLMKGIYSFLGNIGH